MIIYMNISITFLMVWIRKECLLKVQFLGSQGLEFLQFLIQVWDVTKNCVFNQYGKKFLLSGKFGISSFH